LLRVKAPIVRHLFFSLIIGRGKRTKKPKTKTLKKNKQV